MEKVFKIIVLFIPTLFMYHMVNNMLISQTEEGYVQCITIFTFLFVITASISCLLWRVEKLEEKIKEMEQNLNNE